MPLQTLMRMFCLATAVQQHATLQQLQPTSWASNKVYDAAAAATASTTSSAPHLYEKVSLS